MPWSHNFNSNSGSFSIHHEKKIKNVLKKKRFKKWRYTFQRLTFRSFWLSFNISFSKLTFLQWTEMESRVSGAGVVGNTISLRLMPWVWGRNHNLLLIYPRPRWRKTEQAFLKRASIKQYRMEESKYPYCSIHAIPVSVILHYVNFFI